MRLIEKQLPVARKFYQKQPEEIRKRIGERLAEVNPYHKNKAFVNEVVSEMNLQNGAGRSPDAAAAQCAALASCRQAKLAGGLLHALEYPVADQGRKTIRKFPVHRLYHAGKLLGNFPE